MALFFCYAILISFTIENYIKFVFKCISTTNPEKLYYFVLYLGESGKYKGKKTRSIHVF